MHEINDVVVRDGRIVLSHLPYPDGQQLRVLIVESPGGVGTRLPISKVRELLKGGVASPLSDPTAPMIPDRDWEMLK